MMTVFLTVAVTVLLTLFLMLAVTVGRIKAHVEALRSALEKTLEMLSERFDQDDADDGLTIEEDFARAMSEGHVQTCLFIDAAVRSYIAEDAPMPVEEYFYWMIQQSALPYDETVAMVEQMVAEMRVVIAEENRDIGNVRLVWRDDQ